MVTELSDLWVYISGHGSLSLSVEGPHRSDIQHSKSDGHHYQFKYKPHEPGMYLLNVR